VYTAVSACTRPVRPVHGRVRAVHTDRVHGRVHDHVHVRVQAVYTIVYTAVDTARVHCRVHRPCAGVHGPFMAVIRLSTRAVSTAVYAPCRRPCTQPYMGRVHIRVHGRVTAVYMARTRPCTRAHGPLTAMYTAVYMYTRQIYIE